MRLQTALRIITPSFRPRLRGESRTGLFVMAVLIIGFSFYILFPAVLIFVNSFNVAAIGQPTSTDSTTGVLRSADPTSWARCGTVWSSMASRH
jgi:hypothetical protein